jgi:hypothetical protein
MPGINCIRLFTDTLLQSLITSKLNIQIEGVCSFLSGNSDRISELSYANQIITNNSVPVE